MPTKLWRFIDDDDKESTVVTDKGFDYAMMIMQGVSPKYKLADCFPSEGITLPLNENNVSIAKMWGIETEYVNVIRVNLEELDCLREENEK